MFILFTSLPEKFRRPKTAKTTFLQIKQAYYILNVSTALVRKIENFPTFTDHQWSHSQISFNKWETFFTWTNFFHRRSSDRGWDHLWFTSLETRKNDLYLLTSFKPHNNQFQYFSIIYKTGALHVLERGLALSNKNIKCTGKVHWKSSKQITRRKWSLCKTLLEIFWMKTKS